MRILKVIALILQIFLMIITTAALTIATLTNQPVHILLLAILLLAFLVSSPFESTAKNHEKR